MHWSHVIGVFVVALFAVWVSNNVLFVKNIVG